MVRLSEKCSAWFKRNAEDVYVGMFYAALTGIGLGWNAVAPENEWYAPRLTNYCVQGVTDSEAGVSSRIAKAVLTPFAVAADPTWCCYRGLDALIDESPHQTD